VYFVFLGRVTNPSAEPPFLEDLFVSISLAYLLRPVRLGRPYQEHKVPAGLARKVIEARKPPPPTTTRWRQSGDAASMPEQVKRPNPKRKMMLMKSQRDALFLKFILVKNSTGFVQIYCPKYVEFFTKINLRNSATFWLLL